MNEALKRGVPLRQEHASSRVSNTGWGDKCSGTSGPMAKCKLLLLKAG